MLERVKSGHLLTGCLLILPAYLLQEDFYVRCVQVLIFYLLAIKAGKRIRIAYFLILTVSVTTFELFVPWGRVLATLGRWQITQGALLRGVYKGLTVSGLVFISLAAVRRDLTFPGRVGTALGETLYRFESLFEYKGRIDRKRFLASLDELLFEQFDPRSIGSEVSIEDSTEDSVGAPRGIPARGSGDTATPKNRETTGHHFIQYLGVALFVLLNWLALLVHIMSAG